MSRLDSEVEFLKRFRRRFKTYRGYMNAVEDLLEEGLITKPAYNRIVSYIESKSEGPKLKEVKKKKRAEIVTSDPCGRSIPDPCHPAPRHYDPCGGSSHC